MTFLSGAAAFFRWLGTPFRALVDIEVRRAWAVVILWGCAIAMTVYVSVAMFILRRHPEYVLYLGIGGFALLTVAVTAFAGLLVRRDIDLNVLGAKLRISDQEIQTIATAAATAAVAATPTPAAPSTVVVQTAPLPPPGGQP